MKTTRSFKGSWFIVAMVVAIVIAEAVAWELTAHHGVRANPVTVAFLAAGLVAAITMVLYDGADIG